MQGDRVCTICGKKYNYCPNCGRGDARETWRYIYCSNECKTVFDTCEKFVSKKITATEAKSRLDKIKMPKIVARQIGIIANINDIKQQARSFVAPKPKKEEKSKEEIKKYDTPKKEKKAEIVNADLPKSENSEIKKEKNISEE